MLYEVEIIRIDDAFDVLEIEADTEQDALAIAFCETTVFDTQFLLEMHRGNCCFYPDISSTKEFVKHEDNHIRYCQEVIVRDENGNEIYSRLYNSGGRRKYF